MYSRRGRRDSLHIKHAGGLSTRPAKVVYISRLVLRVQSPQPPRTPLRTSCSGCAGVSKNQGTPASNGKLGVSVSHPPQLGSKTSISPTPLALCPHDPQLLIAGIIVKSNTTSYYAFFICSSGYCWLREQWFCTRTISTLFHCSTAAQVRERPWFAQRCGTFNANKRCTANLTDPVVRMRDRPLRGSTPNPD